MGLPKISINIITYNRSGFLAEAIESVLAQSFSDWELIVVDDGSTDGTDKMIVKYQDADKRIIYIKNETNLGIIKSRNKALTQSKGKYVAVLDSDDIWSDTNKLKFQYELLEKENLVLVGGGVVRIDATGKELGRYLNPLSNKQIREKILYRNPFAHSSVVFDKNFALKVGGYRADFLIGEDYDLFLRLAQCGNVQNLNTFLIKYRVHSQNESGQNKLEALRCNLRIIKQYKDKYPNFYLSYARRVLRLFVGYILFG